MTVNQTASLIFNIVDSGRLELNNATPILHLFLKIILLKLQVTWLLLSWYRWLNKTVPAWDNAILKKKKKKTKAVFFLFFFPNGHFKDGKKKRQMTSLRQGSRKCTHMCVYFCKRERERVVLATVPEKELQSLLWRQWPQSWWWCL